jgi:hypothetical protein
MTKFRVLAELSEVYEIEIEADNYTEALEKAYDTDRTDWKPFADREFADDWTVITNSVEEVTV